MQPTTGVATGRGRLPLVALLIANTVSLIGSSLTLIALPWFVLQTTGSATRTGLTGFAVALPGFLVGIFGGTIVDRLGYRRSSVIADVVSGIGIGLVPTLYVTAGLPFGLLLGLVFVGSLLAIPGFTARRSLLPELAKASGVRLERVNALFESNNQLAMLLGPPIAGLLIVWVGASTVLWLDAASFVCSAATVGLLVPALRGHRAPAAPGRYRDQLVEGLRFLLHEPLLRDMALALALIQGLEEPIFAVVLPFYARQILGSATDLGLMASALGLGALAGGAAYGAVGYRVPRRMLWFGAYLLTPGIYWALAARPAFPLLLAIMVVLGFASGPITPLAVTIRHERIPPAQRGRVFAATSAIGRIAMPPGIALSGLAIARLGFRPTVVILAAAVQLAALGMLAVPALRRMDRPV